MGSKEDWEDRFAGQRGDSYPPNGSWLWFNIGKEEAKQWDESRNKRIEVSPESAKAIAIAIIIFAFLGCGGPVILFQLWNAFFGNP